MNQFGSYEESIKIIKKLIRAYTAEVENNQYAIEGYLDRKKALEFAIALIQSEQDREIELFEEFNNKQIKIEEENNGRI